MSFPTVEQLERADSEARYAAFDVATTAVLYLENAKSKRDLATKVDVYQWRLAIFVELKKVWDGKS